VKVALIDNTNNNFFAVSRYLRELDMDVNLYLIPNSPFEHFYPEADTFDNVEEIHWIRNFPTNVNSMSWIFFNKSKIKQIFSNFDLIISCGLSSAFLERAGIRSDIIIPYGQDLYSNPFMEIKPGLSTDFIKSMVRYTKAGFQRRAYKNSRVIIADGKYIITKKALQRLKLESYDMGIPMLYNRENLNNEINFKLWKFLDNRDFIVFNHSRQFWKSSHPALIDCDKFGGPKRNDKLIKAFSKFIKVTTFNAPVLVLFEYGVDVDASKKLIDELNIQQYVYWMPTMNRKNIMYGLQKATFSTNAFRENKTDIGGVCYESLAAGVPHINNCIEANEDRNHKFYQSPMIHALSEDDILDIFKDYEKNPEKYREIGMRSKEWFDKNLGIGLAEKYVELIQLLIKDKSLTQNDAVVRRLLENKN